jgi:uncharacterized OB-fold protein
MRTGIVYTETVVHAAPAALAAEAPYQVAIVELDGGGRVTARITGERVAIGDAVRETGPLNGAPAFRT